MNGFGSEQSYMHEYKLAGGKVEVIVGVTLKLSLRKP